MKSMGTLVALLILSLLGMLWFEQTLSTLAVLELAVILVLVFMALLSMFGVWIESAWSWPLAILYFAGAAANATIIYWTIQEAFLQYALLLGCTVIGFIFACVNARHSVDAYSIPLELENIMPSPKRKSRKSSRKAKRRSR